jgi:hypothetical protein
LLGDYRLIRELAAAAWRSHGGADLAARRVALKVLPRRGADPSSSS